MKAARDIKTTRESHGGHGSRLYTIWAHMKSRCLDPDGDCYQHYGGRGISICDEWKDSFAAFSKWARANGYADNLSIDRIDCNGNYEPSNCRWVTQQEQLRNTRRTKLITFGGETLCMKDMARKYGVDPVTLRLRLLRGWSIEDALTKKPGEKRGNRKYITFNGLTLPFNKMAEHFGLKPATLCFRLKQGMTLEEALTKKLQIHKKRDYVSQ